MQPGYHSSSFWHLVQALRNNQVVAFVGAGVSQAVLEIPTWNNSIKRLLEEVKSKTSSNNPHIRNLLDCLAQRVENREEDLLFAAEQCRKYLLGAFDSSMETIFNTSAIRDQKAKSGLETFLRLPFYRIITTNYDNLLVDAGRSSQPERATDYFTHLDRGCFADYLRHGDSAQRRLIFHLHGHLSRPDSVILAESQYQELYTNREVTDLLEAIFASKSALFIGFGLTDEDIMQTFRRLLARFRPVREQHFALIGRDSEAGATYANWLDTLRHNYKYGLGLINYHARKGNHSRLWEVVEALDREVRKPRKKPERRLAVVMDAGFPYARNLWEIISFLNEAQDEVAYELVEEGLKIDLPEVFVGSLGSKSAGFRDDFRKAKNFRKDNETKYDAVLVFTTKRELRNFFFCDHKWGGFISTRFWDRYVLGSEKGEAKSEIPNPVLYVKRPSIDEYLWHTTAIMTVHVYDNKLHENKLLKTHEPDIGCIFDFTNILRNRLAIIEYPRLCGECAELLDKIFIPQSLKLNADWLRRVVPLAE